MPKEMHKEDGRQEHKDFHHHSDGLRKTINRSEQGALLPKDYMRDGERSKMLREENKVRTKGERRPDRDGDYDGD